MIKYIGSKRRLVPRIVSLARAIPGARTALDLFTGTTRVAQGLKAAGFRVTANDLAAYSEVLARTYIAVDGTRVDEVRIRAVLAELDALPGRPGYFTRTFCEEARYFQPANGARIEAIRGAIDRRARDEDERAILLTSLLEAADRVDSTTGLQMAYLKRWSPRSHRPLALRMPALLGSVGVARREDALAYVARGDRFDVAYLDPPYNQHSYFSNYHIWETLVRGDAPEAYGVARKRADCRTTKSVFNRRDRAWEALATLVAAVRARHVILSFSDEGFFAVDGIAALLEARFGEVAIVPVDQARYVGARIGIHNLRGERVGEMGHLRNTELLFVAGPGAAAIVAQAGEADADPAAVATA